ncbi:MAG: hypothetical protein V4616_07430 [Bacteroidota bacterium]
MLQLIKCELTANGNTIYINPSAITAMFESTQKPEFPSVCIVLEGEKKYYVKGKIEEFLAHAEVIESPVSASAAAPVKKAATRKPKA